MTYDTINLQECCNALDRIDKQVADVTETLERDYVLALAPQRLGARQCLPTGQYVTTSSIDATRHEEASTSLLEHYQAGHGRLEQLMRRAERMQNNWQVETGKEIETDTSTI